MLNRTNRTLSANLNRLNLRTRSFALSTGTNMDQPALQYRHAQGHTVRAGIPAHITIPIGEPYARPEFPASSSVSRSSIRSSGVLARVATGVDTPLAPGLADSNGRVCWAGASRVTKALSNLSGEAKAKPVQRSRGAKAGSGMPPRMPLVAAVAVVAAVGG
jgi:hypothetical protein